MSDKKKKDDEVDQDSKASFPASDPPSFNPGTSGRPTKEDVKKERKPAGKS